MTNHPKVSFLITCYSESDGTISESVRSILNEKDVPLEVILIDDCRPLPYFPPSDIIADTRFKYWRNEKNLGLTKSLNKGLSYCSGELIARLDSDDFCLTNRVKDQVKFLDNNLEYSFCGTRYEEVYPSGKTTEPSISRKISFESFKKLLCIENPMAHSTLMVRTNVLVKIGGYNPNVKYAQDYDLYLRLLSQGGKACVIDSLAVRRTWSLNSISFSKAKAQRWVAVKCSVRAAFLFGINFNFIVRLFKNIIFLLTPMPILKKRLTKIKS